MRRLSLVASSLLLLAACDTSGSGTLTFDGVEVTERGDARLAVENGRLVVSGLAGDRSGGFDVGGTPDRVDVETEPLSVPAGGRFGVEVNDDDGTELASIYNEGTGDGRFDMTFAFADALGVSAVAIRYRLGGQVVLEIPRLALVPGGRQQAATDAGSGSGDSGSVHVIRDRGRYIVVSDAQNTSGARRGCPGFLLTDLPGGLDSEYPGGLCTDWVEVEPLGAGAMPVGRVAVTARGVGSFRVRALSVSAAGQ